MSRFRCVLGPKTDCEFREGIWCSCSRVEYEGVVSSRGGGEAVCKMRKPRNDGNTLADLWDKFDEQLPIWDALLDFRCRCIPDLFPAAEAVLDEVYKKRGTEEEGMMFNCISGVDGRKGCIHHRPAHGKCSLDYISGHRIDGTILCDQYKEEPARCHVCSAVMKKIGDGTVHLVGTMTEEQGVLCIYCHAIYDSIVHGKRSHFGHIGAINMLKGLVDRAVRENIQ